MSKYRIIRTYIPDYVSHHGILGMHWGDRNGPPYPLSGSEHSAVTKRGKKERAAGSDRGSIRSVRKKAKAIKKANKKKAKDYAKQLNKLDRTVGSTTARMAGLKSGYRYYENKYLSNKARSKNPNDPNDKYVKRAKEYLSTKGIMEKEYNRLGKERNAAVKKTLAILDKIDNSKEFDYKASVRMRSINRDKTLLNNYKSAKKKHGGKYARRAYEPTSYYGSYIGTKFKVTSKGKDTKYRYKKRLGSYTPVHTTYVYT